nr:MAG TPA: hypothetical protein [Microviridae sp.]
MKKKRTHLRQFLRCVITYTDVSSQRVLHYAVSTDDDVVDKFIDMINDIYVHPNISFTDMVYVYDDRDFFQII